ncbi:MAG: CpaF family protein [Chloroflexi bacterium]|nr:CpaF family protein [Chloroflexota bacterium]
MGGPRPAGAAATALGVDPNTYAVPPRDAEWLGTSDPLVKLKYQLADAMHAKLGEHQFWVPFEMRPQVESDIRDMVEEAAVEYSPAEREQLFEDVKAEVLGFGAINNLLMDDSISEVMVNGPFQIYIERKGKLVVSGMQFRNDEDAARVVHRIVIPLGRRIDKKTPLVDARLPDGSRVNAVIMPCAIDGTSITIRKFSKKKLQIEDLIKFGSITPSGAEFLKACVEARLNTVVSGGTGSGKTTLLNVLSSFIPEDERVVTIEDSAELQLMQPHHLRLETKPADPDGTGRIAIRDLVINALRMRPERVIVGECRGGEALDMLQAMNTGHDGSMTTLHANSPRDAIARMETMVLMAGMDLPLKVVRSQVSSAIELIVQASRLKDGSRKITHITEVQGMEGDVVVLQDVFVFKEEGMTPEGKVIGQMRPMGIRPKFISKLEAKGIHLGPEVFMENFGRR